MMDMEVARKRQVAVTFTPQELANIDTMAAHMRAKSDPTKPAPRSKAIRELIDVGFIVWRNPSLWRTVKNGNKTLSLLNELLQTHIQHGEHTTTGKELNRAVHSAY
jgi:hypothetical protein